MDRRILLEWGEGLYKEERFEGEGYVSPDYVLPDGTVDENLKKLV